MLDSTAPETFGQRAKQHWVSVVEAAHDAIGDKINARKLEHVTDLLETFERDLSPHVAPYLEALIDNPALPQPLRDLLAEVAKPTNLTSSLIVGIGVGSILGPAISSAFAPVLDEISDQVWSASPGRELSPELAAVAVLKGVMPLAEAAHDALTDGVNAHRFQIMVDAAGNAIGIQEALLLWRRGEITDAHLTEIMRYSNLNPKFYDDVRKLRYQPPGTASVLSGVVQGHLSDAEARDKYQEAGGNPANYTWQYETTGRPPGTEQMLHLLNRNLMSEPEVRAAVRESDIKNKYIDAIIQSRVYLPPPRSIVPMLRHKAVTEAEARQLLAQYGVQPAMIDAFVKEANVTPASSGHHLTQSQILRMYGAHFITRAVATARLAALAYPADEITLLLDYVDETRREAQLNAALTNVRTRYVNHKITKPIATNALTGLQMTGAQVADIFAVWDIERTSAAPNLSVAQWQGALRRAVIGRPKFDAAMAAFGYDADETDLLAALAFPPAKAAKAPNTRDLSVAQLANLYKAGNITHAVFVARLQTLGYSAAEATEIASLYPAPGATP